MHAHLSQEEEGGDGRPAQLVEPFRGLTLIVSGRPLQDAVLKQPCDPIDTLGDGILRQEGGSPAPGTRVTVAMDSAAKPAAFT